MKKTLIALAVLAASGASFAQNVTITGTVGFGYRASTAPNPTGDSSGIGNSDAGLNINASEDLGGGLKAAAGLSFDTLTRDSTAYGGDSFISLGGNFGTVKFTNGNGSDYLSGGVSGVGGAGQDGKVFGGLTNSDGVSYTSPAFSGFTVGVSHGEKGSANAVGIGKGATGVDLQRSNSVSLSYAAGPLAANLAFTSYDQAGTTAANSKARTRISGAYDLGVAKLGAGYEGKTLVTGSNNLALVAVSVPLGALTLGANWASNTLNDTGADGTRSGYSLVAKYALSKRTSLTAEYIKWDATIAPTSSNTQTTLKVAHSF